LNLCQLQWLGIVAVVEKNFAFMGKACRKPKQPKPKLKPKQRHLTFREKQIVDLVSQAKLNKEIAYELHLSEGTIKEYLFQIFRKLGVKNRTDLAVWSLIHRAECDLTPEPRAAATPGPLFLGIG
jgi:DNA-binding NarL/FixJ family response regulator